MAKAIKAYRHITTTPEFKEIERLRSRARHNEAAALRRAAEVERKKWQTKIADNEAALADKEVALADMDTVIAEKDAEIARLRAQLGDKQ